MKLNERAAKNERILWQNFRLFIFFFFFFFDVVFGIQKKIERRRRERERDKIDGKYEIMLEEIKSNLNMYIFYLDRKIDKNVKNWKLAAFMFCWRHKTSKKWGAKTVFIPKKNCALKIDIFIYNIVFFSFIFWRSANESEEK